MLQPAILSGWMMPRTNRLTGNFPAAGLYNNNPLRIPAIIPEPIPHNAGGR
jgi:hypothetical protein